MAGKVSVGPGRRKKARELHARGLKPGQIAREMRLSKVYVKALLKELVPLHSVPKIKPTPRPTYRNCPPCPACDGTGKGFKRYFCDACGGTGERKMARRAFRNSLSTEERQELAESMKPYAWKRAAWWFRKQRAIREWAQAVSLDDLCQEAYRALLYAAERFDPANGAKFSTYAGLWVENFLRAMCLRDSNAGATADAFGVARTFSYHDPAATTIDPADDPALICTLAAPESEGPPLDEDETRLVWQIVDELASPSEAASLRAIFLRGEEHKAHAASLGIAPQTIRHRLLRACEKFRRHPVLRRLAETRWPNPPEGACSED